MDHHVTGAIIGLLVAYSILAVIWATRIVLIGLARRQRSEHYAVASGQQRTFKLVGPCTVTVKREPPHAR